MISNVFMIKYIFFTVRLQLSWSFFKTCISLPPSLHIPFWNYHTALVIDTLSSSRVATARLKILDRLVLLIKWPTLKSNLSKKNWAIVQVLPVPVTLPFKQHCSHFEALSISPGIKINLMRINFLSIFRNLFLNKSYIFIL